MNLFKSSPAFKPPEQFQLHLERKVYFAGETIHVSLSYSFSFLRSVVDLPNGGNREVFVYRIARHKVVVVCM